MQQPTQNPEQLQLAYVSQAKAALREFFRLRNTPFHFRQLEVLFETHFYHIATTQAIYELINDGFLHPMPPIQAGANKVTFLVRSSVASSNKYQRILSSHMKTKCKAIALYDSPQTSKDIGDHFEALVKQELRVNQLRIVCAHCNSYKGKSWTQSNANLDFIADYPDGRAFGIQAKNELKSIEKPELLIQLSICQYLGVKPIFIVRYMPWAFVPLISAMNGFVLTLGKQIYPIGYRDVCQQIQRTLGIPETHLSAKLKTIAPKMRTLWPTEVMTELPEDAGRRLAYWLRTGKFPPAGGL